MEANFRDGNVTVTTDSYDKNKANARGWNLKFKRGSLTNLTAEDLKILSAQIQAIAGHISPD